MLERAKERTAAEFGVVQAVLQAGSTVTTAECEGEPSPGQRPVTGAYKTGLGPLFYEWDALPRPIRVEPWSMNCMLHPVYGQEWDGAFLFTQRSVYQ